MNSLKVSYLACTLIGFFNINCGKGRADKMAYDAVGQINGATSEVLKLKENPLLGSWTGCQNLKAQPPLAPISSQITVSFARDKTNILRTELYSGADCNTPLTPEATEKYIADLEAQAIKMGAGPFTEEMKEEIRQNFSTHEIKGTYAVTPPNKTSIGNLDILTSDHGEAPMYLSYKIENAKLTVTQPCDAQDVTDEFCKSVSGDTPENRAVDFEYSTVFVRK